MENCTRKEDILKKLNKKYLIIAILFVTILIMIAVIPSIGFWGVNRILLAGILITFIGVSFSIIFYELIKETIYLIKNNNMKKSSSKLGRLLIISFSLCLGILGLYNGIKFIYTSLTDIVTQDIETVMLTNVRVEKSVVKGYMCDEYFRVYGENENNEDILFELDRNMYKYLNSRSLDISDTLSILYYGKSHTLINVY